MKKIILAAAILLTTGIVSNNSKTVKETKTTMGIEKSILATAD